MVHTIVAVSSLAVLVACGADDAHSTIDTLPPDATPAALGDGVLVFWGEGGLPPNSGYYLIGSIQDLVDDLGVRSIPVLQSEQWPADIGRYRLILWYQPGAKMHAGYQLSADRIEAIESFLGRGGRLVFGGDIDYEAGEYSGARSIDFIDRTIRALGMSMQIGQPVPGGTACTTPWPHPIMQGVTSISWNAANTLELKSPAQWLTCSTMAVQQLRCGEVVLIGDTQPISDTAGGNPELIVNLATAPMPKGCE